MEKDVLISKRPERNFYVVKDGLMPLLKNAIAEGKGYSRALICSQVDHYGCLEGEDKGWGCGWRNIQMFLSNLLNSEEVQKALPGEPSVPDIPSLQAWLEAAWRKGFDVEGAKQLDWKVLATSKWIGTTECCVILRSIGLRAHIAQFDASGSIRARMRSKELDAFLDTSVVTGTEQNDSYKRMKCTRCGRSPIGNPYYQCMVKEDFWVCTDCKKALDEDFARHFVGRLHHFIKVQLSERDSTTESPKGGDQTHPERDPKSGAKHEKLFEWVWKYYAEGMFFDEEWDGYGELHNQIVEVEKPPLYFQQQGHSQTIVGIRKARDRPGGPEQTYLLILEPCEHTQKLAKMLEGKDRSWRKVLEFGERDFWKPVYQICYVRPGIASRDELESMKILSSFKYIE